MRLSVHIKGRFLKRRPNFVIRWTQRFCSISTNKSLSRMGLVAYYYFLVSATYGAGGPLAMNPRFPNLLSVLSFNPHGYHNYPILLDSNS